MHGLGFSKSMTSLIAISFCIFNLGLRARKIKEFLKYICLLFQWCFWPKYNKRKTTFTSLRVACHLNTLNEATAYWKYSAGFSINCYISGSPCLDFHFCQVLGLWHSSLFLLSGPIGHAGSYRHKTCWNFASLHMNHIWKHCLSFSQMEAGRICLSYRYLVYASIFMDTYVYC